MKYSNVAFFGMFDSSLSLPLAIFPSCSHSSLPPPYLIAIGSHTLGPAANQSPFASRRVRAQTHTFNTDQSKL